MGLIIAFEWLWYHWAQHWHLLFQLLPCLYHTHLVAWCVQQVDLDPRVLKGERCGGDGDATLLFCRKTTTMEYTLESTHIVLTANGWRMT
jgi:hypothetical protein